MTDIPRALRRSPQFIYAAACLLFAWYLANSYFEFIALPQMPDGLEGVAALMKSKALFEATREALYLASSGALLHILIAIYDKEKGK